MNPRTPTGQRPERCAVDLTWRRFGVLLGCLGPNSVMVNRQSTEDSKPDRIEGEEVDNFLQGW